MYCGITKTIIANLVLAIATGFSAHHFMKKFIPIFIQRKLYGLDQCKIEKALVAEPMGVIAAAVYLIFIFIFAPIPFFEWSGEIVPGQDELNVLAYTRLLSLLSALTSISVAILLGFADDILDLRWRHKLLFPTLSSFPLLMIYYISNCRSILIGLVGSDNSTAMLLPTSARSLFGATYVDLGVLFYVYMMMLVIFCTNAINIIAGINGVEAGQAIVIAASVALFNGVQIFRLDQALVWSHSLSLCILLPFIGASVALFLLNRYPARVFVGDTYCYWAGMTLAVVAIIGHFAKTLMLFLVPQMVNFLYSVPQLFHLIPCPRHRLPQLDSDTGLLGMSMAEFRPAALHLPGRVCLRLLILFRLVHHREFERDGESWMEINNLTILNFLLKCSGPMQERQLTNRFLLLQVGCSALAFVFRFYFSSLLYENVD